MKILKSKVYRFKGKTYVDIKLEVDETPHHDKEEMQARLNCTLPWMGEHLTTWADFDYSYTLKLFSDGLIALGKGLRCWRHVVHSTSNGYRAEYAGKALDKAYNTELSEDKSLSALYERNPYNRGRKEKIKGKKYHVLDRTYSANAMNMDPEIYYEKMSKIIYKRIERTQEKNKKEAWEYINKYIEHWWD